MEDLELPAFLDWYKIAWPEIVAIRKMMVQKLSDSPSEMTKQLKETEAQQSRLHVLLAEAQGQLSIAKVEAIDELDKYDMKEFERRARTEKNIEHQQRIYNMLKGISKAMESRLMLGMNLQRSVYAQSGRNHA